MSIESTFHKEKLVVDDTAEPRVIQANANMNVHPRTMATHLLGVIEPLIELMEYFKRHERMFDVSFDEQRLQAESLIIEEADFLCRPNVVRSKMLDIKWKAWSDSFFEQLQDAALDLRFPGERRRLDNFVYARTVARIPYIK